MKIYAISGLGADRRVYENLKLDYELIHLDWITPLKNENLISYSTRLSQSIKTSEPFGIIGVSFGGLIAVEIAKQLKPKTTILISSAETKYELRSVYRWLGKTRLTRFIPAFCFNMPRRIAYYLFGAKNKKLLKAILDDADLSFTKWAITQLINWKNTTYIKSILKINGSKDKLIPPTNHKNTIIIENGGHFMIIDKSEEIAKEINDKLHSII